MNYYIFLSLLLVESNTDHTIAYNRIDSNDELTVPGNQSTEFKLYSENKKKAPLIIGGENAAPGEIPYIVAVSPSGGVCGGSILTKRTILTAAHCLRNKKPGDVIVRAGSLQFNGGTSYIVNSFKVHPEFDMPTFSNNDIALMILNSDIPLDNNNLAVVGLPPQGSDPPVGTDVLMAGWGLINQMPQTLPNQLQKVVLKVLDRSECKKTYGNKVVNETTMICVGSPGGDKSSCNGDSGGPLVRNGTRGQVGIDSFGSNNCTKTPTVYTRVGNYFNWIQENKVPKGQMALV